MACFNNPIVKPTVFIRARRLPGLVPIPDVTKISGLGLGEFETIDVDTVTGKKTIVTDRVTLPNLVLEVRLSTTPAHAGVKSVFDRIWSNKVLETADFFISICIKGGYIYVYKYTNCQLKSYKENDKDIGQANFSIITTEWVPFDVSFETFMGSEDNSIRLFGTRLPFF